MKFPASKQYGLQFNFLLLTFQKFESDPAENEASRGHGDHKGIIRFADLDIILKGNKSRRTMKKTFSAEPMARFFLPNWHR